MGNAPVTTIKSMSADKPEHQVPWAIVMIFLGLSLCISALGYRFYLSDKSELKNKIQQDLSAIADLKANLIMAWRKERLADAIVIRNTQQVARQAQDYMNNPSDPDLTQALLAFMTALKDQNGYASVLLLDTAQRLRLGTVGDDLSGHCDQACFAAALSSREVVFSDLYRKEPDGRIRSDLYIPLLLNARPGWSVVGIMVLRIDPYRFLYPIVQSWPTPSPSAESLIVRQEGNKVLFLSELRHRKNSALSFSLPLDTPGLPEAVVVRGNVGVMEGVDYRGVPVVAALRTIPGTPWYLVAKVDSSEILTPIRERAWVVAIVTTLLIVIAGTVVGFWWKHETTRFYRHELEAERERQDERTRLLEREREARVEAETANRMKDEFLATISHELRTPLNPILGWAYALRASDLDPETRIEAYETIERNARLQSQLVEDLLDVSRIITGKLYLDVRPVDLHSIIRSARDSIQLAAIAKGIRMDLDLAPVNGTVRGDANRLQQVVWNLLSNAVKFTPEHGQISVQMRQTNGHVEIKISDTGIGMSPEFLPYAFDRFRQADEATSHRKGGLGLGLAIVRHIVELHGGTASVSSPGEGKGSTFLVALPLFQPVNPSHPVDKGGSSRQDKPSRRENNRLY